MRKVGSHSERATTSRDSQRREGSLFFRSPPNKNKGREQRTSLEPVAIAAAAAATVSDATRDVSLFLAHDVVPAAAFLLA